MTRQGVSKGDIIVFFGGVLLLVGIFFPWYEEPRGLGTAGSTDSLVDVSSLAAFLLMALVVVVAGVMILRLLGIYYISDAGLSESLVTLVAALVCAVIVLLRVAYIPDRASFDTVTRDWGMWFSVIAATVFMVGALMKFLMQRVSQQEASPV